LSAVVADAGLVCCVLMRSPGRWGDQRAAAQPHLRSSPRMRPRWRHRV